MNNTIRLTAEIDENWQADTLFVRKVRPFEVLLGPEGQELTAVGSLPTGAAALISNFTKPTKDIGYLQWNYGKDPEVVKANYAAHSKVMGNNFKTINELLNKYTGGTAIIVGSGASVLKNYQEIPEIDERVNKNTVVFSINGAVGLTFNIFDYHFTMDWLGNTKWYANKSHIPLITMPITPAYTLNYFDTVYYYRGIGDCDFFSEQHKNALPALQTNFIALSSLLHLCWLMGIKNIALVGMDFCSVNGKIHYDENLTFDYAQKHKYYMCEDLHGNVQMTNANWLLYKDTIRVLAMYLENAGVRVYNCSEGGILNLTLRDRIIPLYSFISQFVNKVNPCMIDKDYEVRDNVFTEVDNNEYTNHNG